MLATSSIVDRIKSSPKIPAPSHVVFKILEFTKDENCPARKVAELIAADGGLTAELLHQANSALFGCRTPTSSPVEACVRLGMKRVRAAVINQHIVNGLGRTRPKQFDAGKYWQSTLAVSVAARDLCQQLLPARVEDAGTAGLLCDIGVGMMAFGIPEEYEPVLTQYARTGDPLHRIERRVLQISHAEVAASVLQDWKLEAEILEAVKHHHFDVWERSPQKPEKLSRIVAAAVTLSEIALNGSEMERVEAIFAQVEALTPNADALVNKLLDGLVSRIQQTAEAFSVELGSIDQMKSNFDDMAQGMPDLRAQMSFKPMAREKFESS
ncbi:MAG TPA: HDOD domain-containing protein [Phycisphaerae bacterium]|nr:HDOD domain-containing protein [Phycisphaerae bacterium]